MGELIAYSGDWDVKPDVAAVAREEFRKRWDPEFVEHLIDGLRKAGLDMPNAGQAAARD